MAAMGGDPLEIEVSSDASDIVASPGPRRSWPRSPAMIGVLGLVAGAILGYLAGAARVTPAAAPSPSASATVNATPGLVDTGLRCATQVGASLQLGVAVTNRSAAPVLLERVRPTLPLGGLVATASTWGACGEQSPRAGTSEISLAPGETTWVTITFNVQPTCPAPLPVSFNVVYTRGGQFAEATIAGFNDLGGVSYSGCGT